MNKGNILILTLIFAVIISLGSVGFFVWKNFIKTKPTAIYLHEGCKPTYKVETGPELTATQNYSQLCYGKSKDDCSKADVYNNLRNDFSQPDGLPDCEWGLLDW